MSLQNSTSEAYGGVFYIDSNSQLYLEDIDATNVIAMQSGGFIAINVALNIIIKNCSEYFCYYISCESCLVFKHFNRKF